MQYHNSVTGVFQIPWLEATSQYESALVYDVPEELLDKVDEIRNLLEIPCPEEFQLKPHLTLVFFGRLKGVQLFEIWQDLHRYRHTTAEVLLGDFGSFRVNERIVNIHIQISAPSELFMLHQEIQNSCFRFNFFSPGSYVGRTYVPHISILDQIDMPSNALSLPQPTWTIGERINLSNLHLIAKQLE